MSTETYEFAEAKPIPRPGRKGAGRKAAPNPFLDRVREIVGQVDGEGDPVARETVVTLDAEHGESYKTRYSRVRRQLTAAGKLVAQEREQSDAYAISMDMPNTGQTLTLTFWHRDAGR